MKFGIGYLSPHPTDGFDSSVSVQSTVDSYQKTIERVKVAEESGFASAWVAEHHMDQNTHFTSPLVVCAALSEATETIQIGTGMLLAPLRNPIRLAEQSATVDLLSEGRFQLGLGLGYRQPELELYDIESSSRVPRLKECVEICRRAWTGNEFSYEGNIFNISKGKIEHIPPQGSNIPILLGGAAEQSIRRAGKIGDGILVIPTATYEDLKAMVEWLQEEDLRDNFKLHVMKYGFWGTSREDAWEKMREPYLSLHRKYLEWYQKSPDPMPKPEQDPEELWKSWVLLGNCDQLAEEIASYGKIMSPDDHLIVRFFYPGLNHTDVLECIEKYGNKILPQVQKKLGLD